MRVGELSWRCCWHAVSRYQWQIFCQPAASCGRRQRRGSTVTSTAPPNENVSLTGSLSLTPSAAATVAVAVAVAVAADVAARRAS